MTNGKRDAERMHADHLRWKREHESWLEESCRWRHDHCRARARLAILEEALDKHSGGVQRHVDRIARLNAKLSAHEAYFGDGTSDADSSEVEEWTREHQRVGELHRTCAATHEQMRQHHRALLELIRRVEDLSREEGERSSRPARRAAERLI